MKRSAAVTPLQRLFLEIEDSVARFDKRRATFSPWTARFRVARRALDYHQHFALRCLFHQLVGTGTAYTQDPTLADVLRRVGLRVIPESNGWRANAA